MLQELDGGHLLLLNLLFPEAEHAVNGRLKLLHGPVALFSSGLVRLRDVRFLGAMFSAGQVAFRGALVVALQVGVLTGGAVQGRVQLAVGLGFDIQHERFLVGNAGFLQPSFFQLIRHRPRALGLGVAFPRQIAIPVRLVVPRLTFSVVDLDLDYLPGLRQLTGVIGHFAIASFRLFEGLAIRALRRNPWRDCLIGLDGLLYPRNS
jgi:hypothetical protein